MALRDWPNPSRMLGIGWGTLSNLSYEFRVNIFEGMIQCLLF